MAPTLNKEEEQKQKHNQTQERCDQIVANLAKDDNGRVQYRGFWMPPTPSLMALLLIEDHFKARSTDVFIASYPKTGTTWLKALIFATLNRDCVDTSNPLLKNNPHDLVHFLEHHIVNSEWAAAGLESLPSPRLLSSHLPYVLLPESIKSLSKFVYICRDPKDVIVSWTFFVDKFKGKAKEFPNLKKEDVFEYFCQGISSCGLYWDHVLDFWKASLENPDKFLFLKYEDLKREPLSHVKRLAEFLGKPFSENEEGVVEEIIRLCSFDNLKELEVNKSTESLLSDRLAGNSVFFRKGRVGDWENHLTPEMASRIDHITEEKLRDSGFSFGTSQ